MNRQGAALAVPLGRISFLDVVVHSAGPVQDPVQRAPKRSTYSLPRSACPIIRSSCLDSFICALGMFSAMRTDPP
jgi:hypothetical protein